jgi:aspartyl-tRNA(Asn)/glutamyl-tRNA(Gln) amidotransferase subunit A
MSEFRSVAEAGAALRARRISAVELVEEAYRRADDLDPQLGVYEQRFTQSAVDAARRVDGDLKRGVDRGPLHGIPVAVKHIITRHAPAFARLEQAGAIVLGATTSVECANPRGNSPLPRNPWDLTRTPGGSSAGSASGVAAGLFIGALGEDTGGSNRIPAAFTGTSALKPTHGLVPRNGAVPLSPGCDSIGPMARSAADLRALLAPLVGPDPGDPSSLDVPSPKPFDGRGKDLDGVRIGVDYLDRFRYPQQDPAVRSRLTDAVEVLKRAGATVVEIEIPLHRELSIARIVTFAAESALLNRDIMRSDPASLERTTRELAQIGYAYTAVDYVQAQRVRHAGQRALAETFRTVDLLLTPTTSAPAPRLPTEPDLDLTRTDPTGLNGYCGTWNATGNPALAVPAGFNAAGLPLGVQFIGRPFEDELVLSVGEAFQNLTDWHLSVPQFPPPVRADIALKAGGSAGVVANDGIPAREAIDALAALPQLHGVDLDAAELTILRRVLSARRAAVATLEKIPSPWLEELTPVFRAVP